MNNKGWSLNEFLAIAGIMTFCLILAVILYDVKVKKVIDNNSNENAEKIVQTYSYNDIENDLVETAMKYMSKKDDLNKIKKEKIEMETLINKGLLKKTYDPNYSNYECDGYVIFTREKTTYSYNPYIKCKKYKTKGYE